MSNEDERSIGREILKEDFNPKSLRVAELRTILLENDVKFKLHDKKSDLIRLFDEHLNEIKETAGKEVSLRAEKSSTEKITKKKRSKRKSRTPETTEKTESSRKSTRTISEGKTEGSNEESVEKDFKTLSKKRKKRATKPKSEDSDVSDEEEAKPPRKSRRKTEHVKNEKVEEEVPLTLGTPSKSPIASKVITKSPAKSPHRSLIIEKFESSDEKSDSTGNEDSFSEFAIKRKNITPQADELTIDQKFQHGLDSLIHEDSTPILPETTSPVPASPVPASPTANKDFSADNDDESNKTDEALTKLEKEVKEEPIQLKISAPEFPTMKEVETLQKDVQRSILEDTRHTENTPYIESSLPELKQDFEVLPSPNKAEKLETKNNTVDHSPMVVEEVPEEEDLQVEVKEPERKDVLPPVKSKKSVVFKRFMFSLIAMFGKFLLYTLIVIPILFGLWYREERVAIGYCGLETARRIFPEDLTNPNLKKAGQFLTELKPACLPCPPNAICYPLMELKCKTGYMLEEPWTSLHGLIPVSDRCVKDSKRQKLIQEVVSKTLELLRTKNAQILCGEGEDDCKSGMSNEELYEIFYQSKKPWISDEEFDALWEQVLNDLMEEPEVIWRQVSIIQKIVMNVHSQRSYQNYQKKQNY